MDSGIKNGLVTVIPFLETEGSLLTEEIYFACKWGGYKLASLFCYRS